MTDDELPDPGVETALEALEASPGDLFALLHDGDEAAAALRRQPLAAVAALAWTLPPEAPPPALRERLLASLSGDETQMVSATVLRGHEQRPGAVAGEAGDGGAAATAGTPAAAAAAAPPATTAAVPTMGSGPVRPTAVPSPGLAVPGHAPARRPPPRPAAVAPPPRRSAWGALTALAATVVALAGLSFYLWRELDATRGRLRQEAADRSALATRVAALEGRQADGDLAAMREQLALVTAPTTVVCALRPAGSRPPVPAARGLLYVAADHQHWYLRAQGLEPPGDGRVYHLWFVVGDQPISAGAFEVRGAEAVLHSPTMPAGTTAAVVTVEPEGAAAERPSGPVVLYGNQLTPLI